MKKENLELFLNKIPLENIKIGMKAHYSQTITDTDIKTFAGISGDRNPVHLDEKYAKNSRYKERIAHGMMTASFFSALFGTKIPGEGCVYTSQSLSFKRPVYINDTVEATVTVTGVNLETRRVKFKTICKVASKIVTSGEAEIYIPLEFDKIIITDKEELLKYKTQIFDLFKRCFSKTIDEKLWEWAYIDNPNGNPIVSLYFDKDNLVGHYAVIPLNMTYDNNEIKAVLSMTTMVDLSYRKYGIFVEQANDVYIKAKELGYKFVCGFPNKKSAPGFKKRLQWNLNENLYVAKLNYDEIKRLVKNGNKKQINFNIQDERNLEWRLKKPNQNYIYKDSNILKEYGDDYDIVFSSDLSRLDENKSYNMLLRDNVEYLDKKQFDYIFGYRFFDKSLENIDFKIDLLMSDVF